MHRPDDLVGFLRLLVSHLSVVIDEGERLLSFYSDASRHAMLLQAIETGEAGYIEQQQSLCRDYEALFTLQMSHAREWVDRLGRLDGGIERNVDEFLASTFAIERLLTGRAERKHDYRIENTLIESGCAHVLRDDLRASVDVEAMLQAVFELLTRLDEQYDLVENSIQTPTPLLRAPFSAHLDDLDTSKVIRLFEPAERRSVGSDASLPQ